MGVKRPLEEENLLEPSFEQHKQLDNYKKLAFIVEDFPSDATAPQVVSPVVGEAKSDFCKLDSDGVLESIGIGDVADEEVEAIEEDVGIQNSSVCSNYRGDIDFDMPWRPPQSYEDPYLYLLNAAPRKEIPIGSDHQAELPDWDPSVRAKDFSGSNNYVGIGNAWEQTFMGTCIIPMPGSNDSSTDVFTVGRGRTSDCSCLDMGSMRCVQQHVGEAREKLRDAIGDEIFTKLGFYEMGEEVARRWTSKDQELFHEVVFSNPGGDLLRHLSALFPTRTKKELVSYYFNVFVLRRRGVQNRSYLLQIDSDHDEVQENACLDHQQNRPLMDDSAEDGDVLQRIQGEDSKIESFSDEELDVGWVDMYRSGPENVGGDVGSNVHYSTYDGGVLIKKDTVCEVSSDYHRTSNGNVPKQGDL